MQKKLENVLTCPVLTSQTKTFLLGDYCTNKKNFANDHRSTILHFKIIVIDVF